jgi:hypothetical protein
MAPTQADIDRILNLINSKDIEILKKEDYEQFQYQGFDPYRLLQALMQMKEGKAISDEAFSDDICKMVAIGLIKGNVTPHNITKMTDAGRKDLKSLMDKYSIKEGGGKGQAAGVITFPRVVATFPDIAVRFTKVLGGKEFRGGPFQSHELPDVMKVQVFPSVIPMNLERKVKEFFLCASLCYSIDQTIKISQIAKPELKILIPVQQPFINLSHNSPLPKADVRRQTFNQLGLPDKYHMILRVVQVYITEYDKSMVVPSENEYRQALAIV